MSNQDENSNLYTTRASGELHQQLDQYINDTEESKSGALRTVLQYGLDAEAADVDPGELQEELDEAKDERDRLQSELDDTKHRLGRFKLISELTTQGFLVVLILNGLSNSSWAGVAVIPEIVFQVLIFIASFAVFIGVVYRVYVWAEPGVMRIKERAMQLT